MQRDKHTARVRGTSPPKLLNSPAPSSPAVDPVPEIDITATSPPVVPTEEVIHLDFEGVGTPRTPSPSPAAPRARRSVFDDDYDFEDFEPPSPPPQNASNGIGSRRRRRVVNEDDEEEEDSVRPSSPPHSRGPTISRRPAGQRGQHKRRKTLASSSFGQALSIPSFSTDPVSSQTSNIPGSRRPPTEREILRRWIISTDEKLARHYLGYFKDLKCLVCPNLHSIREHDFVRQLHSKKHKSRVWNLFPKYCRACPAGPFKSKGLWDDHLSSPQHSAASR